MPVRVLIAVTFHFDITAMFQKHERRRYPVKLSIGVNVCWFAMVALIVSWSADWFQCASKYLYFSSEIGVLLIGLALYVGTFGKMRWSDPPEECDDQPAPGGERFARELSLWFGILVSVMLCVWLISGIAGGQSTAAWLKRGVWAGYMLGVSIICIAAVIRYATYVNTFALATTVTIMVYLLSTYEIILLDRGMGWEYNNTVIGYLFGIPLDNVLFVYPVSPVLAILLYAVVSRRRNNLRAFWLINGMLVPASIAFELLAVYPLDIWRVFIGQSVWPMGKTSVEEFLFYILMQFFSIVLYSFFSLHSAGPSAAPSVKES